MLTLEQIESLPMYEWDIARIGATSPPFTHVVTAESVADYCRAVRNELAHYAATGTAPPTFAYKAAPLRRNEVMHAAGYASPEEKGDRQTPFAKSELFVHRLMRVGDEITSVVTLLEKYERRGSQFITWGCRAHDARGELVADYTYTTIWRAAPRDPAVPLSAAGPAPAIDANLPTLVKHETQEAIDAYAELTRLRPRLHNNTLHSNPEFARRALFGGTVDMGVATAAYCGEVLERAFGPEAVRRLEYKGIRPIRTGDAVTITGRAEGAACELTVVAQDGTLRGVASATVVRA